MCAQALGGGEGEGVAMVASPSIPDKAIFEKMTFPPSNFLLVMTGKETDISKRIVIVFQLSTKVAILQNVMNAYGEIYGLCRDVGPGPRWALDLGGRAATAAAARANNVHTWPSPRSTHARGS